MDDLVNTMPSEQLGVLSPVSHILSPEVSRESLDRALEAASLPIGLRTGPALLVLRHWGICEWVKGMGGAMDWS